MPYYDYDKEVKFEELEGEVISEINGLDKGSEEITIKTNSGKHFAMYHNQDCCENVFLESFTGSSDEIVGEAVTHAKVVTNEENPVDTDPELTEYQESFTWTYYYIRTEKSSLSLRWYGESNGYYSESVDFVWVNKPEEEDASN